MKIEVKIMDKEYGIYSLPVDIEEFIVNPYDIEFQFPDEDMEYTTLPYKDFLFYSGDYYYSIFVNGKNINELKDSDIKMNEENKMYEYLLEHNYISKNENKNPLRQQELSKERAECIANKYNSLVEELQNNWNELKKWLEKQLGKGFSENEIYIDVIYKMKELEQGKDD